MRKTYLSDDSDEEESTQSNISTKILVLGDKCVGKTSFITRLTDNYFSIYYSPTRNIEIHREITIANMKLSLWDVPIHIKYHFKLQSLVAGVVLLLYDTTRPDTKNVALGLWDKMHQQLKRLPFVFLVGVGIPKEREMGSFYIDNMSKEGYDKLLYSIHKVTSHAHH